ncbi:MAG TPA: helix-turn-helix transcriptional regulator, partial [Mycobacterium sp.]|nr:helix-turn-helix transcriptional regulator [Mycobacterium sp.]
AEMIRGNLRELTADELAAARLLAVGEPLGLAVAELVIGAPLMEALEDKRVGALVDTVDGPVLTLGHPLYGEVLRADIAPVRLRRLRRELIAALAGAAASQRDVLRSVVWRLDIGDQPTRSELIAAARSARAVSTSTAERLARAALALDRSVEAVVLLAEILIVEGRVAEADVLLDDLDLDVLAAEERQSVTYIKALGRTRVGEIGKVISMITGTAVDSTVNSLQLQAIYGQALMLGGHVDEAMTVVEMLLADEGADPVTQTLAACTVAAGGAFCGRAGEAERVMRESLPAAESAVVTVPFGLGTLMVATAIGLAEVGRLAEAEAIGRQMYDRALAEDDEWLRPRGASALGVVALRRGQARTATRLFRIVVASLNNFDGQYLRYNVSYLVRGAALAGDVEEARQALDSAADSPDFPLFHADWIIAEAALHAADGAYQVATEHALRAAQYAASRGQWATMGIAAFHAARYTAAPEAVALTATAAERVEDPLYACIAAFARARSANDAPALSSVSQRFEGIGTLLYAVEADHAAARIYQSRGDGHAAARSSNRAAALYAHCENAAIPWASGLVSSELLTRREQQIALLAATGDPDAAIAAQLQISIRTVQNHLTRAYRKLDITNRRDLPNLLGDRI